MPKRVDVQFKAILEKNNLARLAADGFREGDLSCQQGEYIIESLEAIEKYVGVLNQPSVRTIFEHNSKQDRQFDI